MVQSASFFSAGERQQVRQIAKLLFWGNDPADIDELKMPYETKWAIFFDVYCFCRSAKTGDFMFPPFPGGYFDQPAKSLAVLQAIQGVYRERLQDLNSQPVPRAPRLAHARRPQRGRR